jgi:DNA-binding beta-propeller fold protein YncE
MTTDTPAKSSGQFKALDTIGFCADVGGRGFHLPNAMAIRDDGHLYVISRSSQMHPKGTRIGICDVDHEFYGEFSTRGTGPGEIIAPTGIVLDSENQVYVTDEQTNRVTVFDTDGKYLCHWGERGSEPGQLSGPAGLIFDSDDNLYVSDQWNHRIQKFSTDGGVISSFGEAGTGPGQFDAPWGITTDGAGHLFVADWHNDRISKFTLDGEPVMSFGEPGREDHQLYRPADVAVDAAGFIYVADWGNQRAKVFDADGNFQQSIRGDAVGTKWGADYLAANADELAARQTFDPFVKVDATDPWEESSRVEGYFWNPTGIEVDKSGRLFVIEAGRHRFQVYERA